MIKKLSAEQKARFPEFVEKWTRIGLCTDPADRDKAEEGVRLAYRTAGLEAPSQIVWCGSPSSMAITRSIAQTTTAGNVGDTILKSVWTSVQASVEDLVLKSVSASVRGSVWNSVWHPIAVAVLVLARASCVSVHGQHGASWQAYYDYFRVVCGLTEQTEKMLGLMQVAENAGWWSPHEDICWISERTNRLLRDDQGRLHCEDGPALSYPDGWSLYAIHGVLLNEQIIMRPRSQDVDKIRKEPNAEVKRIRIERFGWAEYLREVGAVLLDTRHNDVEATKEALMRTPDRQVVLLCSCPSTARVYCLEVPLGIVTCEGAQDWLSGGLSRRVINGA